MNFIKAFINPKMQPYHCGLIQSLNLYFYLIPKMLVFHTEFNHIQHASMRGRKLMWGRFFENILRSAEQTVHFSIGISKKNYSNMGKNMLGLNWAKLRLDWNWGLFLIKFVAQN